MCLKIPTTESIKTYSSQIEKAKEALNECDSLVIGAGAGLSTAAGFTYSGERFKKYFSDFEEKYGFHDMYSGGFNKFDSPEEYWAYWSRMIYVNRYLKLENSLSEELKKMVEGKDYFVITTNVDHFFQKAGFDKKRLFYTQGDYGLFQCKKPCENKTYDNEEIVRKMFFEQKNMKIPTELIPTCPDCGGEMTTNLRADEKFVEDEGWLKASDRYADFLKSRATGKILFLELGVGYNTPSIIKYPFWQMTYRNEKAKFISINLYEAECPKEIEDRSIIIANDIKKAIHDIVSKDN